MSLASILKRCVSADPKFMHVSCEQNGPTIGASTFVASPEYGSHPLVLQCKSTGGSVIPVALYSDGVQIGEKGQEDTLYVIYITFPHLGAKACSEFKNNFIYTVYRKSDCTANTLNDIWDVFLWELQALQHGREPLLQEMGKPLDQQQPGQCLFPAASRPLHFCLMQVRGDWAWYVEALGVWQWNCKAHMCDNLSFINNGLGESCT